MYEKFKKKNKNQPQFWWKYSFLIVKCLMVENWAVNTFWGLSLKNGAQGANYHITMCKSVRGLRLGSGTSWPQEHPIPFERCPVATTWLILTNFISKVAS